MTHSLPISPEDYFGPAIGALVFIGLMSLVKEPARRNLNAIVVGGAMGAYISGASASGSFPSPSSASSWPITVFGLIRSSVWRG